MTGSSTSRPERTFVGASAAIALSSALAACAGWVPGRQSYWDAKVKEMCKKDGGVRIFKKLQVSKTELDLLERTDGQIGIPIKQSARPNAPVYAVHEGIPLGGAGNVHIARLESTIVRRADQAVLARWVAYSRTGGDFPSPAHESTFWCPDLQTIRSDLQAMFIVEGGSK